MAWHFLYISTIYSASKTIKIGPKEKQLVSSSHELRWESVKRD